MKRAVKKNQPPPEPADERVLGLNIPTRRLYTHREGTATGSSLIEDSIVWVQPDERSTPESMAATVELMKKNGAVAVVAVPLDAKDAPAPRSRVEALSEHDTARAIAMSLAGSVEEDLRGEVERFVDDCLGEAGL